MIEKKQIFTENAPSPAGPYSQGIIAGQFVFVAGQRPADPKTNQIVEGGIEEQTAQVIKNLEGILKASGSSLDRCVSSRVFLSDIKDFSAMNSVYEKMMPKPYPVRTTTQCTLRDILVEIDVIALKNED
jgi:2-iminobutanoate/2-iminopropanoate deaminase